MYRGATNRYEPSRIDTHRQPQRLTTMPAVWPFISVGDVVEIVMEGRQDEQSILNTFHYQCTSIVPETVSFDDGVLALNANISALTGLQNRFLDALASDYTLLSVRYQLVQPNRFPFIRITKNLQGHVDEPALPCFSTVSIERRGEGATRRNIGRLQLAAVPAAWVTNGVLNGGEGMVYTTLATEMTDTLEDPFGAGSEADPVLITAQGVGPAPAPRPILATEVKQNIRSMTRRVVGRGI